MRRDTVLYRRIFIAYAGLVILLAASAFSQEKSGGAKPSSDGERTKAKDAGGTSANSANLINENQLLGLPLNGRSYSQLATLEAGVSDPSASSASRGVGGGNLTISGSRSTSNHYMLDGTTVMNASNQVPKSAAGVQLGSDSVFQVQIFSGSYQAEYGRSSGGILNSITRSGTPQLHGTLFEYLRNSKLDARNFFDKESSPPPFKRNQFGFSLTGPIKKDKTYFLLNYEAMRDRLSDSVVTFFPDLSARLGFPDAQGRPTLPVAPSVVPYLNLYPIPNDASVGNGVGRNVAPEFLPTNENFVAGRVDHRFTDRDSLFARYTLDLANGLAGEETHLIQDSRETNQQYVTVVGTHIYNLRSLQVFRFGYARPSDFTGLHYEIDIPQSLYFVPGDRRFGQINIPGLSPFGGDSSFPRLDNLDSFQFGTQSILQRGTHALKIGADFHRTRMDVYSLFNVGGVWNFNSLRGFLQAGPVGTNLIVALPGADNHRLFRQNEYAFYVQDEYRVNSRLSVNFGLRYEPVSAIKDRLKKSVYMPDPARDKEVLFGNFIRGNPSLTDFGPRLGFSWSPFANHKTVVSAGGGIYYDPFLAYVTGSRRSSTPYYNIAVIPNLDTSKTFPNALAAAQGAPFLVQVMDYNHMSTPAVYRYNFAIQQSLPGGWNSQAQYVGARGNHLYRRYETNQFPSPVTRPDGSLFFPAGAGSINPTFGSITIIGTDAQSFYNAMQLTANRSLRAGLSLQVSYTLSKSVDDSTVGHSTNSGQYPAVRILDRSLSDFDIRHRLTFNYFYSLPGMGAKTGAASKITRGWRLGGIVSVRTGTPFSAQVNVRYRDYLFAATRPDLAPGASNNPIGGASAGCGRVAAGTKLGGPSLYFDPCAFAVPAPGLIGNLGRNTLTAPKVVNMDISLQRDFSVDSKRGLQFRMDVFNMLNHANFAAPSTSVFSGENGDRTTTAGRISKTSTTSRQIQFALRFSF